MTDQTTGACLCGSVTFTAELPSKWVAHCHCTMCQRAHGAAFVTWVSVEEKRVTVRDLQGVLRWYSSSVPAQRGFCKRCGSALFSLRQVAGRAPHRARQLHRTGRPPAAGARVLRRARRVVRRQRRPAQARRL